MGASIKLLAELIVLAIGISSCSSEVVEKRSSSLGATAPTTRAADQEGVLSSTNGDQKSADESPAAGQKGPHSNEGGDESTHNDDDLETVEGPHKPMEPGTPPIPDVPKNPSKPNSPVEGASSSCDKEKHKRLVPVTSSAELKAALLAVKPGDLINLKGGEYTGPFLVNISASASDPITLCGSAQAILSNGGITKGRVLSFNGVSYWRLIGVTVRNGQKGIMTEESSYLMFDGITVHSIGHEAVHFKTNSHHNTLQNSRIYDTGLDKPDWGEGLYFGTAKSNGTGDKSDYNNALNNTFGPGIAAEHIDAKEYSSGGLIEGNTFDGTGMTGANSSESIIYIKGNDYVVRSNHLKNPFLKGIRVWDVVKTYSGYRNLFEKNTIENLPDLGISIEGGEGNIVKCDNSVPTGGVLTNVKCE